MVVESQIEPESELVIEEPNITNRKAFKKWLDRYVQIPFRSFEDETLEERIKKTKKQLRRIAIEWTKMGRTPEQIKKELVSSVRRLQV